MLLGEEKIARSVGKRRESVGSQRKCRLKVSGGCGACAGHVRFLSACDGGYIGFVEILMS